MKKILLIKKLDPTHPMTKVTPCCIQTNIDFSPANLVIKALVQPFWTKMKIGQSRILQLSCSSNSHKKKIEKLYPTFPLSAKLVIDHPNCAPNDSSLTAS